MELFQNIKKEVEEFIGVKINRLGLSLFEKI